MDCGLLPSESGEDYSHQSHPSFIWSQSANVLGSDNSFLPSNDTGFSYDEKSVSLMDLDVTFLAQEACYSPQVSYPVYHDLDIRSLVDSSPDHQLLSFQFQDDIAYPTFASDPKFIPTFTSSPINLGAPFLQQPQQSYDPVGLEMHQDFCGLQNHYIGLPSLPLLSNSLVGESTMNTSQLYMPFEAEYTGNSGSVFNIFSQCQYDMNSFGDNMQFNPSPTGFPNVQSIPPAPGQADLGFESDPLRVLPQASISGLNGCCLGDSNFHTRPSTMPAKFASIHVQLPPLESLDMQACSIPRCHVMQSAPARVSATRAQERGLDETATRKMGEISAITENFRALEEYSKAQIGPSSCQDGEDACLRGHPPENIALLDTPRKHSIPGNKCRPLVRAVESHLPRILNDESVTHPLKTKEMKTRKYQSQIERTSVKRPLLSSRKRRARKSVERKLNEAILIFNNMESISVEAKERITQETAADGFPRANNGDPFPSTTSFLGNVTGTKCTDCEDKESCAMISVRFSGHNSTKKDEDAIAREERASGDKGKGNFINRKPQSSSALMSGVHCQENVRLEGNKDNPSKLSRDEVPFAGNSKDRTAIENIKNEDQCSTQKNMSSFYTSSLPTEIPSLNISGYTIVEIPVLKYNEKAGSKVLEPTRDSLLSCAAAVKTEIRANASEAKAQETGNKYVCSKIVNAVQSKTKSEGPNSKSLEEENKSSGSCATSKVRITDCSKGNIACKADDEGSPKEAPSHTVFRLLRNSGENNRKKSESDIQEDNESSGNSDTTCPTAAADNRGKDKDDGSCHMHPSSPSATVCDMDSNAQIQFETKANLRFFEDPSHQSSVSTSNETCLEGSEEVDHGRLGQHEKPEITMCIDKRVESMGSDSGAEGEAATDCSVEILGSSDAFTSSFPYSKIQCEISTNRRREPRFTSLVIGKLDDSFNSVTSDEIPDHANQGVQISSSDSAVEGRGKSATTSALEEIMKLKLCSDDMAEFSTGSLGRRYDFFSTQDPRFNVDHEFSNQTLAVGVNCSSDSRAGTQNVVDCEIQSDLDIESSTLDQCLVKSDVNFKGKDSIAHVNHPSYTWKISPSSHQANSLEGLWQKEKESMNSYQEKLLKILTDFIESGYGVGVQVPNAAHVMMDDPDEPDIFSELRKGTVIVPSTTLRFEKDQVQRARWNCTLSKQGAIDCANEVGRLSSSTFDPLSGISSSDSLREAKTSYRPILEKVHRTRSRSRSGWGGLRQF